MEAAQRSAARTPCAHAPTPSASTPSAPTPTAPSPQAGLVIIIAGTQEERLRLAQGLPAGTTALLAADIQQAGRVVAQLPQAPAQLQLQHQRPRQNRPRHQPSQPQLRLRADRLSLTFGAREVSLTKLELDVLAHLLPRVGETVTFEQLSHVAWHTDYLGNGAHMHAAVGRLRAKLAQLGAPVTLQAVRGLGFRLVSHSWEGSLREAVGS